MIRVLIFCVAILSVMGCRTTVTQEAGLDPAFFTSQLPQLTSDERGFWYVIAPHDSTLGRYVTIKKGGTSKIFYAMPKGKRTSLILPISKDAYGFLDPLRDGPVDVAFTDDATTLNPSDSIGWYSDNKLQWLGPAPTTTQRVVFLATGFEDDIRISTWLKGTATFENGALVNASLSDEDAFVVPDGPLVNRLPSVVAYGAVDVSDPEPLTMARVQGEVPPGFSSSYYLRPLAQKLNAHVVVYNRTRYNIVFARDPRVHNGLALAVTDVPMLFTTNADETRDALFAMVDVLSGNYLTGLYRFAQTAPSTTGGVYGGQLRLVEIAGAAGYVDWSRFSILNNAIGVNADDAIYIARAHLLAGHTERAMGFIQRAIRVFATWRENDRLAGFGRANFLASVVRETDGELEDALQASLRAAQFYSEAGDELRAGEAERRSAYLASLVGKTDIAIRAGSLARSRFYHGNAKYESGLTEIELSDLYRASGDAAKSEEMLKFAKTRFSNLSHDAAVLRVNIAAARASGDAQFLQSAVDRAWSSGDVVTASDAAASLVALGDTTDDQKSAKVLAAGLASVTNPFVRHRVRASMDALCAQGVANNETASNTVRVACDAKPVAIKSKPIVGAQPMLTRGYDALSSGDLKTAETVLKELRSLISEDLRQRNAMQVAEIVLFNASVARAGNTNEAGFVNEAVDVLRKSVDPTKLAETLDKLADAANNRGEAWLSLSLLSRAALAAEAQGQNELLRDLSLKRIETAYRASDWDELTEAIRTGNPVFTRAGDRSAGLLAISGFYSSVALTRSGKSSEGAKASVDAEKYLEKAQPKDAVRALIIGSELAAENGDTKSAQRLVRRGKETLAGTARGLIPENEAAVFNAEFDFVNAKIRAASGDSKGAYASYKKAYESVLAFADARSVRLQRDALDGAGKTAPDTNATQWVIGELERQRRVKPDPKLLWAIAEIEILSGSPDRARKLLSTDENSVVEAVCINARALALIGKYSDAKPGLKRCQTEASYDDKFQSKLLDVLAGPDDLATKRARLESIQSSLDRRLSNREVQQVGLALELLTNNKGDAKKEAAVTKAVQEAKNPADVRKKTAKAVDVLVSNGQPIDALTLLDADIVRNAFYEKEAYQPALIRLRMRAMVHAMRPVKAMNYGYQVADVLNVELAPDDAAATLLSVAKIDLVVGLWHHGRTMLRDAYEASKSGRDRTVKKEIEAIAKRFDIPLK